MTVTYTPEGIRRHHVVLTRGDVDLVVESKRARIGAAPPASMVTGDEPFVRNLALIALLEMYAHSESQARLARNEEKRRAYRDHAEQTKRELIALAALVAKTRGGLTPGWCSICLVQTHHRGSDGRGLDTYICESCRGATTPCVVPRCKHFSARGTGRVTTPRYCAEHVHAIPSFANQDAVLGSVDDWESWHRFAARDAGKLTRAGLAVTGTAVVGAVTFGAAAPAIGGMVGHAASALSSGATLTGAAATSHGLALLGFGSLAAGGLGMAGGAAVITAVGTAVGAKGGLRLATAYGNEDPSFDVERVRDGSGPPVLVATGFTTEKQENIDDWFRLIDHRYAGRPVYYVRWGAKERRDLQLWLGGAGARAALKKASVEVAKKATKAAGRSLSTITGPLGAISLASNPWTVAYHRAIKTGYAFADVLSRTDGDPPVLFGHSLGGRVMAASATFIGTKSSGVVESVHLLGAAVPNDEPWRWANEAVSEGVFNYWSKDDGVLARQFRLGQYGHKAIGQVGARSAFPRVIDINVSRQVKRHGDYMMHIPRLKTG